MNHERFVEGHLTTNFIAEEFPDGFHGLSLSPPVTERLLAIAASVHRQVSDRNRMISGQASWHVSQNTHDWVVRAHRTNHPTEVEPVDGGFNVLMDGRRFEVRSDWEIGQPLWTGIVNHHPLAVQIDPLGTGYRLIHGGAELKTEVLTPRASKLADLMPVKVPPDMSKFLLSPMPGLLSRVSVDVGQEIKAGQELAVVEAMKMENILRADNDGVVAKIHAAPGSSLAVDQTILEFA
jgi:propionyl-CoA carboxylase alpha chain